MEHGSHHDEGAARMSMAGTVDPVCGMTVDPETQRSKGLVSTYEGREYFFCGKGCKLDFDEEPARYLEPGYSPSM